LFKLLRFNLVWFLIHNPNRISQTIKQFYFLSYISLFLYIHIKNMYFLKLKPDYWTKVSDKHTIQIRLPLLNPKKFKNFSLAFRFFNFCIKLTNVLFFKT
jgi:hypothetical protein